MCGIVGYLGTESFKDYIIQGLMLLQNRGYDSTGITSVSLGGSLTTTKYASTNTQNALEVLKQDIYLDASSNMHTCAIGHTRWATHGAKTQTNAHPHHDNADRISLVHNGIIENYQELKTKLTNNGYQFHSQTDTEVIAVLIGYYLDRNVDVKNAIRSAVQELKGTWALVIVHRDFPDKLWTTRNGSPLLLGMEDEYVMIASEQIAFGQYIKKFIVLDNHDLTEIVKQGKTIQYSKNVSKYEINHKSNPKIDELPSHYAHWMNKEIKEQAKAINQAMNNGGRIETNILVKLGGLDAQKDRLSQINHLIILGCGTSLHAGLWSLDLFKSLECFYTVSCYDGAEFTYRDIPKQGKSGVILLSQSGETKDLHRCIQIVKEFDALTIGVVNVIDSLIARETDCGVYLNAGREVAVASTKSFSNQCVVLSLIAVWFSQNKNTHVEKRRSIIHDLRRLSDQIHLVFENEESVKTIAKNFTKNTTMFLLGKGKDEAIAKEGALKIKEVSYIHAEGYSSSALKHGAFALIEDHLPIIILDVSEEHRDKNENVYREVSARNAKVIRIVDYEVERDCDMESTILLTIEKNNTFGGIIANIYIQMLSYYIALEKGVNPDFPRNLAKVVTVE